MNLKTAVIIALLGIALLIQNTCPQGFAGKSAVASTCSHCPQKQAHTRPMEVKTFSSISPTPAHLPMYVLDSSNTQPSFRLVALASPQPVIKNTYKNTAPDELLQPPRA